MKRTAPRTRRAQPTAWVAACNRTVLESLDEHPEEGVVAHLYVHRLDWRYLKERTNDTPEELK